MIYIVAREDCSGIPKLRAAALDQASAETLAKTYAELLKELHFVFELPIYPELGLPKIVGRFAPTRE